MKKLSVWIFSLVLLILPLSVSHAEERARRHNDQNQSGQTQGYRGPGTLERAPVTAVSEVLKLPGDSLAAMQGYIIHVLKNGKYEFQDSTGSITLKIDRKLWQGISADENTLVEIRGKVNKELFGRNFEVKTISIL